MGENYSNNGFAFDDNSLEIDKDQKSMKKAWYRSHWFYILIGILIIAATLLALWLSGVLFPKSNGLTFFINYENVQEIQIGANVYFRGFVVGEVLDKVIVPDSEYEQVKVLIYHEYKDLMSEGSVFRQFDDPSVVQGSMRAIEIKEYAPTYPKITADKVYLGADDAATEYLQAGKLVGNDVADKYLSLGELRVKTVITGTQINRVIVLESGTLIPQDFLFSNALPKSDLWNREEETFERRHLITLEGQFLSPQDASWNNSTIELEIIPSLFWTDYFYSESFQEGEFLKTLDIDTEDNRNLLTQLTECLIDPNQCLSLIVYCLSDLSSCKDLFSDLLKPVLNGLQNLIVSSKIFPIQNIPIQMSLELPGMILDSNAESHKGRIAYWSSNGELMNQGFTLTAKSRELKLIPILIVIFILLALIAGFVVLFLRKKKKQKLIDEANLEHQVTF